MKTREPNLDLIPDAQIISESRYEAPAPAGGGFSLNEILVALFRHKGKIALLGALGVAAAAVVYLTRTPLYESQAKIRLPWVPERISFDEIGPEMVSASGRDGRVVLNAEVDLLTSWDVAEKVVAAVGVEKILPDADPETGATAATRAILNNLIVNIPKESIVLQVAFQHPDPALARAILVELLDEYLSQKSSNIQVSAETIRNMELKANTAKAQLEGARTQLIKLKDDEKIISLENREEVLSRRQAALEEQLILAQSNKAKQQARLRAAEAVTATDKDGESDRAPLPVSAPGTAEIDEYRALAEKVSLLRKERDTRALNYKNTDGLLTALQNQLDEAQARRQELDDAFPGLATTVTIPKGAPKGAPIAAVDVRLERAALDEVTAEITRLQTEIATVEQNLSELLATGTKINAQEAILREAQENYDNLTASLRRAQDSTLVQPEDMRNITILQQPSVGARATADFVKKLALALAFGGFALGIGIAFLIEVFLDRSIKRPQEIESRLQLPLMLSIPFLTAGRAALQLHAAPGDPDAPKDGSAPRRRRPAAAPTPWDPIHFIRPFADAIRDRIEYHFQINNLTHNPKLVGLTGFSDGSGTSTLAASLAASFAETTDGKILYVNLNCGAPLPPGSDPEPIGPDGLPAAEGEPFGVTDHHPNLFVASIPQGRPGSAESTSLPGGAGASRSFIPKRLFELIPKLKASDFEFIIFDMPPLGPTSPTVAMAGFMDKVLLVVDAGKTDREVVRRAYLDLAAKGTTDVSTILNKTRESLPTWLQG